MHGRSAATSFAEIRYELFDKQVICTKGEKVLDFMQAPASPRKVCDKNERSELEKTVYM